MMLSFFGENYCNKKTLLLITWKSWQHKILLICIAKKKKEKNECKIFCRWKGYKACANSFYFCIILVSMHFGVRFYVYCTISIDSENYWVKNCKGQSNQSIHFYANFFAMSFLISLFTHVLILFIILILG